MIKIFRKIRHQLITEHKFSKYFFYAIGEIILVVIGILIAENLAPTLKGGFSNLEKTKKNNFKISLIYCALAPFLASDEAFLPRGMHKASVGNGQNKI